MSIKPFFALFRKGQLSAFLSTGSLLKPFYKLVFLAAAKEGGFLDRMSAGPVEFEELAEGYCRDRKAREALEAWLQVGLRLGLLDMRPRGYALKGLAKQLSLPRNDAAMAMLEEVAGLHCQLIAGTPQKLRDGELWSLDDQDGEIIARSSRILEAFQTQGIDRAFPRSGAARLLEIGCGSGFYIQYAAARSPSLTALGLELQPNVAEVARRNIAAWGLAGRVQIETGDIRDRAPAERFDIVTLYNNIYYFPVDERVALLRRIREFLKPGGFLLLITCCQGGSLGVEALNLWGAATATGGRLPTAEEMAGQLREAGFTSVEATSLIPGDKFYAFKASTA